MNVQDADAPTSAGECADDTAVIDCDIHPRMKSTEDFKPYMDRRWWDYLQTYGVRRRHGYVGGHPYPKTQPADGMRRDSFPPDGSPSGSSVPFMREQHLDRANIA